jgi:hypothetical protein
MKTKNTPVLALLFFMIYGLLNSAKALPPKSDSCKHKKSAPQNDNLTSAVGTKVGTTFLQDVRYYNIKGATQVHTGCIPQPAASAVGYMGFKVGDKVKWGSAVDKKTERQCGTGGWLTGTIDLLDSDRCYIAIDHTHRFAVKGYDDIEKVNP